MNADGTRSIGTPLARNAAYEALILGHAFTGEIEILGAPYETHYEPILDGEKLIGVYYFGIKKI